MENESKWKNRNFIKSVKCTLDGIWYAIKNERNIKIQLCFALMAVICGFVFRISFIEWCTIVFAIFFVLASEMFNTAIEKAVDLCTEEYSEIAKIAKDVSGGAVLLSAINSVIVGLIVFLPKFLKLIGI